MKRKLTCCLASANSARPSPWETTIGPHATVDAANALLPAAGLIALCTVSLWRGLRRRAWYERELTDRVAGRLSP